MRSSPGFVAARRSHLFVHGSVLATAGRFEIREAAMRASELDVEEDAGPG
jgi:hypothetical protein